jgi:putative transposase
MRHTTFRFALDPTSDQAALLARHAGASRFAYNQSLRLVTDALAMAQAACRLRCHGQGLT